MQEVTELLNDVMACHNCYKNTLHSEILSKLYCLSLLQKTSLLLDNHPQVNCCGKLQLAVGIGEQHSSVIIVYLTNQ